VLFPIRIKGSKAAASRHIMEDERRNTRKEQRLVEVRMIQEVKNCLGYWRRNLWII
jgi:hypothetical protein